MIGKREIRMAVTGALLFLAVGSLQACATDNVAGPSERIARQATDTPADSTDRDGGPVCTMLNRQIICL